MGKVSYYPERPFKLVKDVRWIGPPSGVYGQVELTFADGSKEFVDTATPSSFRPKKKDIIVEGEEYGK